MISRFAENPPFTPNCIFAILESEMLNKALSELSKQQQDIFRMNRFDGFTYREIAEKLEINQKTVEYHMSIALKKVYSSLKGYVNVFILVFLEILFKILG